LGPFGGPPPPHLPRSLAALQCSLGTFTAPRSMVLSCPYSARKEMQPDDLPILKPLMSTKVPAPPTRDEPVNFSESSLNVAPRESMAKPGRMPLISFFIEQNQVKSSGDLLPGVHRAVRGRAVLPGWGLSKINIKHLYHTSGVYMVLRQQRKDSTARRCQRTRTTRTTTSSLTWCITTPSACTSARLKVGGKGYRSPCCCLNAQHHAHRRSGVGSSPPPGGYLREMRVTLLLCTT